MSKTIELASINDISNVIESKCCEERYYYHIKNKEVSYGDIVFNLIVMLDLKSNPIEVFYTRDIQMDDLDLHKVIGKKMNSISRKVLGSSYDDCLKNKPNIEVQLVKNINDTWFKL